MTAPFMPGHIFSSSILGAGWCLFQRHPERGLGSAVAYAETISLFTSNIKKYREEPFS
jgi:hypothetical protein